MPLTSLFLLFVQIGWRTLLKLFNLSIKYIAYLLPHKKRETTRIIKTEYIFHSPRTFPSLFPRFSPLFTRFSLAFHSLFTRFSLTFRMWQCRNDFETFLSF
jgi:hypothetical protein